MPIFTRAAASDEVLVDGSGRIVAVSAEVGGFLGLGNKEIVMDLGMLMRQGDVLAADMTEEEVEVPLGTTEPRGFILSRPASRAGPGADRGAGRR